MICRVSWCPLAQEGHWSYYSISYFPIWPTSCPQTPPQPPAYIIKSLRLEKTSKIIKSNGPPTTIQYPSCQDWTWSMDYTDAGSLELEGSPKGHQSNPPATSRDTYSSIRCSEPHPAWPWVSPGMGHHHLSVQPVPVPHHPDCKKPLPYIQPKSPLF